MTLKKRPKQPLKIYELEIALLGIGPRIWRRFAVRSNHSLMVLHDIIQMVIVSPEDLVLAVSRQHTGWRT
jgi:hypothetical protein